MDGHATSTETAHATTRRDRSGSRFRRELASAARRPDRCSIIFEDGTEGSAEAQAVLNGVNALGATYEGMTPRYLSVDIPPRVDLMAIARFLTDRGIQWEHADQRYAELYPDEA